MSHKFRFTDSCLDRLKEYGQRARSGGKKPRSKPARDKQEPSAPAPAPEKSQDAAKGEAMNVWTRTDIGKVRSSNQDALIQTENLLGVADGMGGHNGGEVASAGARDGLIELLQGKEPDGETLRTAIVAVNRRLYLRQKEDEALSGMGTTLTVLWLDDASVHVGHVGDSRAYRLREGELAQITQDHSVVAEMVREGLLTREQAACHPMRNVITRAVGTEEGLEVDILRETRRKGDLWLVCSDGLYGMVPEGEIRRVLTENKPDKAADLLLKRALDAGGRDNVSLVILLDEGAAQ